MNTNSPKSARAGTQTVEAFECSTCGLANDARSYGRRLRGDIVVTKCSHCGVSGLLPAPTSDQLREHYSSYYLTQGHSPERLQHLSNRHKPVFDYLLRHAVHQGRLSVLDYGFGAGAFLHHVAARGHTAFGADVSTSNLEQLRRLSCDMGLEIEAVEVSAENFLALAGQSFDVVTLFQVIEHVPKPLVLLKGLTQYQDAGGLLYVECPNDRAALCAIKRLLPSYYETPTWGSLKYPEHLHGFTRHALSALYERLGYEMVECGDYPYHDGFHQVESEFWWPRLRDNAKARSLFGLSRSAVPAFDYLMSKAFGAGSGLLPSGEKKARTS